MEYNYLSFFPFSFIVVCLQHSWLCIVFCVLIEYELLFGRQNVAVHRKPYNI